MNNKLSDVIEFIFTFNFLSGFIWFLGISLAIIFISNYFQFQIGIGFGLALLAIYFLIMRMAWSN